MSSGLGPRCFEPITSVVVLVTGFRSAEGSLMALAAPGPGSTKAPVPGRR